jgi:hypothetical protein
MPLLSEHVQMVFNFYLVKEKINIKFLLASWKQLLILKIVPEATLQFLSAAILLCLWWISVFASLLSVNFSSVRILTGFRNNFHDHKRRGFLYAFSGSKSLP